MSDFSDLFSLNPDQQDGFKRRKSFEESVVKRILTYYQLSQPLEVMRRHCADSTGSDTLTLDWFHMNHPGFPVHLGARIVPRAWQTLFTDLVKRMTSSNIYDYFEDVADELEDEEKTRAVGLVFRYPELGMTVMHNYPPAVDLKGARFVRTFSDRDMETITIEPLDSFLHGLAWNP